MVSLLPTLPPIRRSVGGEPRAIFPIPRGICHSNPPRPQTSPSVRGFAQELGGLSHVAEVRAELTFGRSRGKGWIPSRAGMCCAARCEGPEEVQRERLMAGHHEKPPPNPPRTDPGQKARRKVLIVDPDHLTRWSVETYLSKTFEVLTASSVVEALKSLGKQSVQAIVISDDLPNGGADEVEGHARLRNACVVAVRTVSQPMRPDAQTSLAVRLEKPFKLSALAAILGVSGR